MPERTSKLRAEVEVAGAEKGANDLKGVADAQDQVTGKVTSSATEASKAADATKKLKASESDYVETLRSISPVLGNFVDSMIKGSKVAGDLASQNVNLTGVFGKLGGAIKANAGALKLLIAGGAVAAGIYAIAKAVEKMREEHEAATKAIQDEIAAMTELRQQQRDEAQALEDLADKRREGGYATADEARAAAQQVQRVRERAPFLDEQAVAQAVALGGADRTVEELQRIAVLLETGRVQIDPARPEASRERQIDRALERHAEVIDKTLAREREQNRELYKEAQDQARIQLGGSLDALVKVIEPLTRGEGVDPMRLAKALQVYGEARESAETMKTDIPGWRTVEERTARLIESAAKRVGIDIEGGRLSAKELAILERLAQTMEAQAGKAEPTAPAAPTVQNNYPNARIYYPDARSQQEAIRNGDRMVGVMGG